VAGAAALLAIGLLAFLGGLASDPATAWRAFHVNFLYFAGLGQAGAVLAAIFVIVGARWPGPVRRIAEGLAAWVPVTLVLFLVGFLGGRDYIYPWIEHPVAVKAAYLNEGRLFLMDFGIFFLLAVLTYLFLKASVRPTLGGAADEASGFARTMIERWTVGWKGEAEEIEAARKRTNVLAPLLCMAYALGFTFIAFDQVMSLSPLWFSNLFGAFFAWGGFLSCISLVTVLCVVHRNYPGLEGQFTKERFHDLGKMIFAFSIFWMYLFFSQYLVIWYGNLPEETFFIEARLGSEFLQGTWFFEGWWGRVLDQPWVVVTLFAWICIWVVPFWFLLGQKPKRTWWFVGAVACVSLLGFWVERNVLAWPSWTPDDTWAFLGWIQIGTALGFLGAFTLVYLGFTRVFPSLAVPAGE